MFEDGGRMGKRRDFQTRTKENVSGRRRGDRKKKQKNENVENPFGKAKSGA